MSRTWTYRGFTSDTNKLIVENVKVGTRVIVDLDLEGKVTQARTEDVLKNNVHIDFVAQEDSWYGEGPTIEKFTFSDGRVWESYIQEEPWSSGPVTFMAMRDFTTREPITETLWPQELIDAA
jgi:hypothetical protein